MKLLVCALGALGGVVLAAAGFSAVWPAIACAAGVFGLAVLRRGDVALAFLVLLASFAAAAGTVRYEGARVSADDIGVSLLNGQIAIVRGFVVSDPDHGGVSQNFTLRITEVQTEQGWQSLKGDVLVTSRPFPRFDYGNRLELEAEFVAPPVFPDFDYRDYLARQGIVSVSSFPSITRLDGRSGSDLHHELSRVRGALSTSLQRLLPEPESALARGMLIGERAGIPRDLNDQLNRAGISHLVVISGSDVMIVAYLVIAALAGFIGRRPAILLSMLLVLLYASFVGAQPPVLRATGMAFAVLGAQLFGRPDSALRALAISAAVLVLLQPRLVEDVAFQLSLAATFGVVTLSQPLGEILSAYLQRFGLAPGSAGFLGTGVGITAAASIAVLPVSAFHFGSLSLLGVPANLVAELLFVPILAFSAFAAAAGVIWQPFGEMAAPLAYWPLHLFIVLGKTLGGLDFAAIDLGSVGATAAILLAVLLAVAMRWLFKIAPRPKPTSSASHFTISAPQVATALVLVIALSNWHGILFDHGDRDLRVTFLDVGQGDAALIETPGGRRIIIDGGPGGDRLMQQLGSVLPFPTRDIDLLVLSHGQDDHVTGLVSVLERLEVKLVMMGPLPGETAAYDAWRDEIDRCGISILTATPGSYLDLGDGIRLEVLGPTHEMLASGDLNNNSIVLRLTYGDISFLFTGDIEAPAETALVRSGDIAADVLKVPHHGSDGSSTTEFLAAVQPRVAVISVGEDNNYGHPAPGTLLRLSGLPILRTDLNGRVSFFTDGHTLRADSDKGRARLVEAGSSQ